MKSNLQYILFLKWLLLAVTVLASLFVLYYYDFLHLLYIFDPTKITFVISLIYIFSILFSGVRVFWVSKQLAFLSEIKEKCGVTIPNTFEIRAGRIRVTDPILNKSILLEHISDMYVSKNYDQTLFLQLRSNKIHDKNEILWYCSDLVVTLGLLGTVIGFVIALWPFFTLGEFSFEAVKGVLATISSGIGVALFTTVAGISANILIKLKSYLLEAGTNQLLTELAHITEIKMIPYLKGN